MSEASHNSSPYPDRAWELYIQHLTRAWNAVEKQTESFDRSLLTLSTSGLGVSLLFIKDIVSLNHASWLTLLYASWILFAFCILTTVASFRLSVAAHNEHIAHLQDFYFPPDGSNKPKEPPPNPYQRWLTLCTFLAGVMFLAAMLCTIIFCVRNVENTSMTENKQNTQASVKDGQAPHAITPVPIMQSTTGNDKLERGLQPPKVTPVPPSQQPGNQGGSQSDDKGNGGSSTAAPNETLKK